MQILLLLFVLGSAVGHAPETKASFESFKQTFNKRYADSIEEARRMDCFAETLQIIAIGNAAADNKAVHGINSFADLCHDEFRTLYNGLIPSNKTNTILAPLFPKEVADLTDDGTVDWRSKGAVTPVKNQGQCGSCWSFSATGNVEGQWFVKTGNLVAVSEQELVSCDRVDNGCSGGLMDYAFNFIVKNGGIDTESDYPYTSGSGRAGTCETSKLANKVVKITGHVDVSKDEKQMAAWVQANGPLSIAVDAGSNWQTYTSGILSGSFGCKSGQPDHGVLIVGFGIENSTPFWIVKNSWDTTWGESGYVRLTRGVNCNNIQYEPSSSTV